MPFELMIGVLLGNGHAVATAVESGLRFDVIEARHYTKGKLTMKVSFQPK